MWRERIAREDGVALIYVLFATMLISGLVVVFMSRILFENRSTAEARDFESAIHVGEAGAEALFGEMNSRGETNKYVTTDGSGNPHVLNSSDEEQWAITQARNDPGGLVATADGQAYGIRPEDGSGNALDIVFGVGFVPSMGAPNETVRVVKMQVARRHFSPDHAMLTGGSLTLGGNAEILAPGCDTTQPDTCNADVHANGDVDVTGSAHTVQGDLTATGTISGSPNTEGGTPSGGEQEEPVPHIEARDFYNRDVTYNADPGGQTVDWYDLCPGGTVREPSSSPCTGTQIWPTSTDTSTKFRGWSFKNGTNTWQAKHVEAGIFYVYRADASVTGSAVGSDGESKRAVTILVETDDTNPTKTGSLQMGGNPDLVAALPDTLFIVDRDIKLKGTAGGGNKTCDPDVETCDEQRYTGFVSATEQLDVSGTVYLTGSMISEDAEDLHGLVTRNTAGINGTMNLDYDDDLKIDLTGRVTIEFWNEL